MLQCRNMGRPNSIQAMERCLNIFDCSVVICRLHDKIKYYLKEYRYID